MFEARFGRRTALMVVFKKFHNYLKISQSTAGFKLLWLGFIKP